MLLRINPKLYISPILLAPKDPDPKGFPPGSDTCQYTGVRPDPYQGLGKSGSRLQAWK